MAGFTIDLVGRVKNFDLPKTQPLIPLYEAIEDIFKRKEAYYEFIG